MTARAGDGSDMRISQHAGVCGFGRQGTSDLLMSHYAAIGPFSSRCARRRHAVFLACGRSRAPSGCEAGWKRDGTDARVYLRTATHCCGLLILHSSLEPACRAPRRDSRSVRVGGRADVGRCRCCFLPLL